jgi:hypothetical protein
MSVVAQVKRHPGLSRHRAVLLARKTGTHQRLDDLLAARRGLARRCGARGARGVLGFDAHDPCLLSRLRNC